MIEYEYKEVAELKKIPTKAVCDVCGKDVVIDWEDI